MKAGQRVRIKTSPDRIGVLLDDVQEIGGKSRWLVQFHDTTQRLPERNLEIVIEDETLESLITRGRYGEPSNIRGAITHTRLTGRLADVIYSMEATNTEFFAYQYKPVLNFLDSPSNGILIADEVGLGKTIEAGLIWTELRARMDANRLLILCPAVLCQKWADELLNRFGIRSQICNAEELLQRLEQAESYQPRGFALIASLQGTRPSRGWQDDVEINSNSAKLARYIEKEAATRILFDCVIIDEAHYLRNPNSQTNKFAHLIRPATSNIVLLSATPIQLKSEDLYQLLKVIDVENFEFKQSFDNVLTANEPLLALASALKSGRCNEENFLSSIEKCIQHPLLNKSHQLRNIKKYPPSNKELEDVDFRIRLANRIERINLLGSIVSRTRKRDVQENRVIREPISQTVEMNAIEQEFYETVTKEVRSYCQGYELFEGFLLTTPQRQMCSSMPAALRAWLKKMDMFEGNIIYETVGDMITSKHVSGVKRAKKSAGPLVQRLASFSDEIASYEQLKAADSKYDSFLNLIKTYWRNNPNAKLILFSFFRETLNYLQERLLENKIESELIMGGMGREKHKIISHFKSMEGPNILLTSEVLSEGVDLQFSSALINYDLPWNPMRIEQRIGRIDRIGQQKERILIWNFFYKDTLDDRVYNRLLLRLQIFKTTLGDIEEVLGEKLHRLTYELLTHDLTAEQELERIEQTAAAIATDKELQEQLEDEAAGLAAHADYILDKVAAAKEMRRYIDGSNLWIYIRDYLQKTYQGCQLVVKTEDPLHVEIELSLEARADLQHFLEKNPSINGTVLTQNNTGKGTVCYFSNQVDFGNMRHEVINQYHPLVRFVSHKMKITDFNPLAAIEIDIKYLAPEYEGVYIVVAKRWSTKGAKTIERLIYRGVNLNTGVRLHDTLAENLVTSCIEHGEQWMSPNAMIKADDVIQSYFGLETILDDEFDDYCEKMKLENEDRVDLLIANLRGNAHRQINSRNEAIETLKFKENFKMIKLHEGIIKKIKDNYEKRKIEFEKGRYMSTEPSDVITAVINVKK